MATPRPSPARKWRTRQKDISTAQSRRTLTSADVQTLARRMREAYRWDADPRPFQLAGVQAQLEGVDCIIQAATGSGKTAIAAGPHLWHGNERSFTIMVCPLLSLEDEMVQTFKDDFGLDAIAFHSKNGACSPLAIRRILANQYRVILVSPEMLQSRMFMQRILRNTVFMRDIVSLFIDEAHCISHWGADFRKKYSTIGIVRAFLPRGTPVIAVTATMTARVRRDITTKLHFPKGASRFINVGNDRKNVSIVVRANEHPLASFADLDFVVPEHLSRASDIPKTYIYVDNINTGGEIVDYLQCLAERKLRTAAQVVRPYNAQLSHDGRTATMEQFRDGRIRIVVCTDAAGMGMNTRDVDVVVQWKLPAKLSNWVQRAGRAARDSTRTGLAVLIVERSAYSIDLAGRSSATHTEDTTRSMKRKCKGPAPVKASKGYAAAHGLARGGSACADAPPAGEEVSFDAEAIDEGMLAFVQTTRCRRRLWVEAYESPPAAPSVPCCDICDLLLFERARPGLHPREKKARIPQRGIAHVETQLKLMDWREQLFARELSGRQLDDSALLDDSVIEHLSSIGTVTPHVLRTLLSTSWIWWDSYAPQLIQFMQDLTIPYIPLPKKARATTAATKRSAAAVAAAHANTPLRSSDAPPSKRHRGPSVSLPSAGEPSTHSQAAGASTSTLSAPATTPALQFISFDPAAPPPAVRRGRGRGRGRPRGSRARPSITHQDPARAPVPAPFAFMPSEYLPPIPLTTHLPPMAPPMLPPGLHGTFSHTGPSPISPHPPMPPVPLGYPPMYAPLAHHGTPYYSPYTYSVPVQNAPPGPPPAPPPAERPVAARTTPQQAPDSA